MAYDLCFDRCVASDLQVLTRTDDEGLHIDRTTFFSLDTRHSERLAVFDGELLATGFYDCVTHCLLISTAKVDIPPDSRKVEIIRKTLILVKRPENSVAGEFENRPTSPKFELPGRSHAVYGVGQKLPNTLSPFQRA